MSNCEYTLDLIMGSSMDLNPLAYLPSKGLNAICRKQYAVTIAYIHSLRALLRKPDLLVHRPSATRAQPIAQTGVSVLILVNRELDCCPDARPSAHLSPPCSGSPGPAHVPELSQ